MQAEKTGMLTAVFAVTGWPLADIPPHQPPPPAAHPIRGITKEREPGRFDPAQQPHGGSLSLTGRVPVILSAALFGAVSVSRCRSPPTTRSAAPAGESGASPGADKGRPRSSSRRAQEYQQHRWAWHCWPTRPDEHRARRRPHVIDRAQQDAAAGEQHNKLHGFWTTSTVAAPGARNHDAHDRHRDTERAGGICWPVTTGWFSKVFEPSVMMVTARGRIELVRSLGRRARCRLFISHTRLSSGALLPSSRPDIAT